MFTHASWTDRRSDSYERLAFLGDSVLSLAVSTHLFQQEGDRFGAGRLTKVRAQAVSGRACRRVAEQLRVPERLRAMARERSQRPGDAPERDECASERAGVHHGGDHRGAISEFVRDHRAGGGGRVPEEIAEATQRRKVVPAS